MKITDISEIEIISTMPPFEVGSKFAVYQKSSDVVYFKFKRATFSNQWIKRAIKRGIIKPTRMRVYG